jgi:hypothetical protein
MVHPEDVFRFSVQEQKGGKSMELSRVVLVHHETVVLDTKGQIIPTVVIDIMEADTASEKIAFDKDINALDLSYISEGLCMNTVMSPKGEE